MRKITALVATIVLIGTVSALAATYYFQGFETDTSGYLVGVDRRIGEQWLVGVNLGQSKTDVNQEALASGRVVPQHAGPGQRRAGEQEGGDRALVLRRGGNDAAAGPLLP